jgi:hypothetical protein
MKGGMAFQLVPAKERQGHIAENNTGLFKRSIRFQKIIL